MPEQAVAEAPAIDEPKEFGTPLEEIFARAMPGSEEEIVKPEKDEKKEEPKLEAKPKKAEAKKEEKPKEESKPSDLLTDILEGVKPVEKKEEKIEDTDLKKEEAPVELKGKAREHFERLSTEKHDLQKQLRLAQKKAEEAEKKGVDLDANTRSRLEQLEKVNQDLSQRLGRAGLELHPWFEQNFIVPRKQAMEAAVKAFKDGGGNPEDLETALKLDGRARAQRLDELYSEIPSTTLKGKVERAVDAIELIDSRKEQALKNRNAILPELQKQDQAQQAKMLSQQEQILKSNLEESRAMLRDKFGFFVFKQIDDPNYSWWNDDLKKMNEEAETLMLRTSDPKELAVATNLAVVAPRLMAILKQEIAKRRQAEKERDEYRDSQPGIGKGSRKGKAAAQEEEEDKSLTSAILDHIHGEE
jgi:hypothetical protein